MKWPKLFEICTQDACDGSDRQHENMVFGPRNSRNFGIRQRTTVHVKAICRFRGKMAIQAPNIESILPEIEWICRAKCANRKKFAQALLALLMLRNTHRNEVLKSPSQRIFSRNMVDLKPNVVVGVTKELKRLRIQQ